MLKNRKKGSVLLTFKDYLAERINIEDGALVFDYNDKSTSSTKLGKHKFIPYSSAKKNFNGVIVKSIFQLDQDIGVKVLKALKGKNDINVQEESYKQFIKRTVIYINSTTSGILKDIDVIVSPSSSSKFNDDVLDAIKEYQPSIKIIKSSFIKNDIDNIIIDFSQFPNVTDKTKKSVESILKKAKDNGFLEVKNVPKMFLNYFSNVLKLDDMKINAKDITDKNVLIFDDLLGSGFTFTEMINNIKIFSPVSISGVTIFKTK